MTKELALKHALRKSAKIHRDHWARTAWRCRVQPASNDFFAGAMFASDKRIRIGRSNPLHQPQHGLHRSRLSDQCRRAAVTERAVLTL